MNETHHNMNTPRKHLNSGWTEGLKRTDLLIVHDDESHMVVFALSRHSQSSLLCQFAFEE